VKNLKRLLIVLSLPIGAFLLSRCGETCSSEAADVENLPQCTLAADSEVTIELTLCAKCTQSSPSCVAEVVGDRIELAPTYQACEADKDCSANACEQRKVICAFQAPAAGSYTLVSQKAGDEISQPITISANGATSCSG
jgi:hypothetical protein